MKRVAIYARYSTELQSPTSIAEQVALCRAHAERHGWTVAEVFEDRALSGGDVYHRPGYQQLMAAALSPAHPFDVVLVEDLSRLTREIGESDTLYRRLRLRSVDLVGVTDGVDTSRRGASTHIALKGVMNALYLEDLAEKTHRGLVGRLERGLSAGGRIFGYRTVSVPGETRGSKVTTSARFEIDEREAAIVRQIFRAYTDGKSMKAIVHRLNFEGVPFPAKDTKRGPARRGWAVSTIHVMLGNEKYAGVWIWNKTRFLKDPDSGRRRPIARPPEEWIRHDRPELRIIEPDLWRAVQDRLAVIRATLKVERGRLRGRSSAAYSPRLLSGLVRCGACGARMVGQTFLRKKNAKVYRYSSYRCGFAAAKGPAVCAHGRGYRADRLEAALVDRFREATTPAMIDALTISVNTQLAAAFRRHLGRADEIKAELLRLEREAGNLVRFIAGGHESSTVREELTSREAALAGLRLELARHDEPAAEPPSIDPAWVRAKLERLEELLRAEPARAKIEIAKHLDGELVIEPLPDDETGHRRAQVSGRVKSNGLLANQEAVYADRWLRGLDLNQRPLGYEPNELPGCSTPR